MKLNQRGYPELRMSKIIAHAMIPDLPEIAYEAQFNFMLEVQVSEFAALEGHKMTMKESLHKPF